MLLLKNLLYFPPLLSLAILLSASEVTAAFASMLPFSTPPEQQAQQDTTYRKGPRSPQDPSKVTPKKHAASPRQLGDMPVYRGDKSAGMPIIKDGAEDRMPSLKILPQAYVYVDRVLQFKGGEEALEKFITSHLRYSGKAKEAGTEGLVVLSCIVHPDGSLSDVQVIKRLGNGQTRRPYG